MPLQAIRNLIGISPKYESDKIDTTNGVTLYKHESFKGRTVQGIVKYIGPHCKSGLQIGDYVFYSAYAGQLWSWKGELILFMEEEDILCKIDNIPDFIVPGLYFREKIDDSKNRQVLEHLMERYQAEDYNESSPLLGFVDYLKTRVDAYGAFFEAPRSAIVQEMADAFKNEDWTNSVRVGEEVKPQNLELYKDEKRICQECGGEEQLMRDRSTTKVFYRCKSCGNIRDRQMYKDVEK